MATKPETSANKIDQLWSDYLFRLQQAIALGFVPTVETMREARAMIERQADAAEANQLSDKEPQP